MKRGFILTMLIFSLAVFTAIIAVCAVYQRKTSVDTVYMLVETDKTQEKVYLYCNDGVYYALLPSYADFSNLRIGCDKDYSVYIDGERYRADTVCSKLKPDESYTLTLKDTFGCPAVTKTIVLKKAENIAAVSIHLTDGELVDIHANKTVQKSGLISIVNSDKSVEYAGNFRSLRGRGNSTWTQPKKSYLLSFDLPIDLHGMGAATDWVLLANSVDESGLRNKLVFDTAKALGLNYAVDSEYIDLYVNNRYMGLYLLTEQVEVGLNRVNITNLAEKTQLENQSYLANYPQIEKTVNGKIQRAYEIPSNPSDITGGYLLQIEHHEDRILTKNSLFQTGSVSFSLSSPKYASAEQIAYISDHLNGIEEQLQHGDLSEIDIVSFAKLYFLQEVFANTDNCSVFFYKDSDSVDGKVYAGPVWDFDLSMGNGWRYSDMYPLTLYRNTNNWFNYLEQNSQFQEMLTELFTNNISIDYIAQCLEQYKAQMEKSFIMNRLRWSNVASDNNLDNLCQKRFDTLDEHILRIVGFMQERLPYLESLWKADSSYVLVSFASYDFGYYSSSYVSIGNNVTIPKEPQAEGYQFVGWFDENGDVLDPQCVVTKSQIYTARWEEVTIPEEEDSWIPKRISNIVVSKTSMLVVAFGAVSVVFIMADLVHSRKSRRCKRNEQ